MPSLTATYQFKGATLAPASFSLIDTKPDGVEDELVDDDAFERELERLFLNEEVPSSNFLSGANAYTKIQHDTTSEIRITVISVK